MERGGQTSDGEGIIPCDLAELNLLAGRKARASAAYESAFDYLQAAVALLRAGGSGESVPPNGPPNEHALSPPPPQATRAADPPPGGFTRDPWEERYDLTLRVYEEAAESAYLTGHFDEVEHLVAAVLQRAQNPLDQARIYEVKFRSYLAQNRLPEAVQTALVALELLGVTFPETPTAEEVDRALQETLALLKRHPIEQLIDLPAMVDPSHLAALSVLAQISTMVYLTAPPLFVLMTLKQVTLSIAHGNTPSSPMSYAALGVILCGMVGDIDAGYAAGQLALRLVERLRVREVACRTAMSFHFAIRHWKEPLRTIIPALREVYRSGMETGDLAHACYGAYHSNYLSFLAGAELEPLEAEMAAWSQAIARLRQTTAIYRNEVLRQMVLNLMGRSENPLRLRGEAYNEDTMLPRHLEAHDVPLLFLLSLNRLILGYLFGDQSQVMESLARTEAYAGGVVGLVYLPVYSAYDSLARLALLLEQQEQGQAPPPDSSPFSVARSLERVGANQAQLHHWAQHAPSNVLHRYELVEAERCRLADEHGAAREHYDRAIALAQEQGYLQDEALACERAARFYLAKELHEIAAMYLHRAHYVYLRWGALAKVRDMETRYAQFGIGHQDQEEGKESEIRGGRSVTYRSATASSSHPSTTLDMTSVSNIISRMAGEIMLDTLLEKLMRIVLENAGAQRGFLILDKSGQWVIEAIGAVDRAEVAVLPAIPVETHGHAYLSTTIVHYVARTHTSVMLHDARHEGPFAQDSYIQEHHIRSVLCLPLIHQGNLRGMLYLENNEVAGAFTEARLEVLNLLSGQIVTSIDHAYLYGRLEELVEERTLELSQTNRALQDEVIERKRAEEMLRKARDELEQRVQERTAELSRTNTALHAEIAERRLAEQQLRHRTLHDALTNLPNRTLFAEILGHAMKYAKRHRGYAFAVIFLDLDNFKVVNDSLGHLAGDQLLVTTAGRLKACLRTSDTVARFGGDEFVILLEDVGSINEVTELAKRIQEDLAVPLVIDNHEVITSTSIGIVLGSSAYVHPTDVLRDADTAMYRAKSLGPGNYTILTRPCTPVCSSGYTRSRRSVEPLSTTN
ncbi:MAG: diguanylate cyclase [Chloroflexaceae bacterium]|nr:diguanylate cyclase [Chloroflexaceae bacterium]